MARSDDGFHRQQRRPGCRSLALLPRSPEKWNWSAKPRGHPQLPQWKRQMYIRQCDVPWHWSQAPAFVWDCRVCPGGPVRTANEKHRGRKNRKGRQKTARDSRRRWDFASLPRKPREPGSGWNRWSRWTRHSSAVRNRKRRWRSPGWSWWCRCLRFAQPKHPTTCRRQSQWWSR